MVSKLFLLKILFCKRQQSLYGVSMSQLYTETFISYLPHRTLPYSEGFRGNINGMKVYNTT